MNVFLLFMYCCICCGYFDDGHTYKQISTEVTWLKQMNTRFTYRGTAKEKEKKYTFTSEGHREGSKGCLKINYYVFGVGNRD